MSHLLRSASLSVWIAALCLSWAAGAQVPVSFQIPMLGHVPDSGSSIRPVVGIVGSAKIGTRLALPFAIDQVALLPDQRHAVVSTSSNPEVLVLDLVTFKSTPVTGASSSMTSLRTSVDGSMVALYYAALNRILIVSGLPSTPTIFDSIDVSFSVDRLSAFAISNDGRSAMLAFSSTDQDLLYSWTHAAGLKFVTTASRISDVTLFADDAMVADSGADQVLLISNVPGQAVATLVADSRDGISQPVAISVSTRHEFYVGNSATGTILVLDAGGHVVRRISCGCKITTMAPMAANTIRLTSELDRPVFVLEHESADRILFIPALPPEQTTGSPE